MILRPGFTGEMSEDMLGDSTPPPYHGSLVAFEGPEDTVATQLRLLPASPQILVLPSIEHYMPTKENPERSFSARSYVRNIHIAAASRYEAALQFLKEATPERRRQVFLCGGTAGAQALCLSGISKNETGGDISKADSIFGSLVKQGVVGLWKDGIPINWQRTLTGQSGGDTDGDQSYEEGGELQDPISRAMRAADALDEETSALQLTNNDADLAGDERQRSTSPTMLEMTGSSADSAPFYLLEADPEDDDASSGPQNGAYSRGHAAPRPGLGRKSNGMNGYDLSIQTPRHSQPDIGDAYHTIRHSPSILSEAYGSRPPTPEPVVYGEARLVQMRFPGSRNQSKGNPDARRLGTEANGRRGSRSIPREGTSHSNCTQPRYRHLEVPEAMLTRAGRAVTRQPPMAASRAYPSSDGSHVDRTTDAAQEASIAEAAGKTFEGDIPFQPVLPLKEDLVIRITDENPKPTLDFVIEMFKEGFYPVQFSESLSSLEADENPASPATPTSPEPAAPKDADRAPVQIRISQEALQLPQYQEEYDPYACHAYNPNLWEKVQPPRQPTPPQEPPRPPTPRVSTDKSIPKSVTRSFERTFDKSAIHKFHNVLTTRRQSPLSVQNAVRAVLAIHFPSDNQADDPSPPLLQTDPYSLWNPVFYDPRTSDPTPGRGKVDLVLAIGTQAGVRKDYLSRVAGQIERLAVKPKGASRGGRVDMRFEFHHEIHAARKLLTALPLQIDI